MYETANSGTYKSTTAKSVAQSFVYVYLSLIAGVFFVASRLDAQTVSPGTNFESIPAKTSQQNESSPLKIIPLLRAHAHNDYLHDRPLLDALDQGFCSVEADVFLVNDQLLVAHTQFELKPEATLESLYLKPLQQRVQQNQGSVYGDQRTFTLLVDFKTNGEGIYHKLESVLENYPDLCSRVKDGMLTAGPVQIIVSGDRPIETIASDNDRLMGLDGRLADLESDAPVHFMPLISDQWNAHFEWKGRGEFPADQMQKLKKIVAQVHSKGRRIRFWGIPDKKNVWQVMKDAEVDLINTDKLTELKEFLLEQNK